MLGSAMRRPSLRLAFPIALALAVLGCNAKGQECEGLRRVAGGEPLAGAGLGESAKAVEKTLADLDAVKPTTSDLAPARGEYRAALASLVEAARKRDAVIHEMVGVVPKDAGLPALDPALPDKVSARVQTLAEPCMKDLLGGMGSLFQKGGAPPAPPSRPDCEKLGAVLFLAIRPLPGASVAAHARAVAAGLEAAKLDDPSLAEAARGLAALVRELDPLLSKVTIPAADLALGARFTEANRRVEDARAAAAEKAAAVTAACPAK
jgi:hypothetical protein